ncbi:class III lanthionine synthetase LanKC [Actinokineospora sp. UTMC 2448]|uniref:class III lanthionine synthetase LanKC n=1 Tax=Actinokineospora sp. UTMC 2448 TaxID=2268449 RepID=UPI0021641FA7|nr:class III lanthionine synthetase LanKC [Actinokineospora sp. UTMC 2448]UVS78119.1 putative ATPase [Actinokineospora sp. UTMC 2448]
MDLRYEAFCFADPLFFDEQRVAADSDAGFAALAPTPATGWASADMGTWRVLRPDGARTPDQGWKIHVSATLDNAEKVLAIVADHCFGARVAFKHLRGRSILLARNAKYAPRSASGKLVTVYPADDNQLAELLVGLAPRLAGFAGPYILSDLRYGDGPLYVRYGGFVERWVESDGARVLALRGPDGELVPDERTPTFRVPPWVELPACLAPHLAARRAGDPDQFPYRVSSSLHFSNGGGVYRATRKADDRAVVVKEARPHAGLDRDGVDAVARLEREYDILRRLDGIAGVPRAYELTTVWEHSFLAMEPMEGLALGPWLARTYPLTRHDPDDAAVAAFTERVCAIVAAVERLLDQVHGRGVVFGDLHSLNILVDEDDTVSLIDYEMAFPADSGERPALGAPGFRAPADRAGVDIDRYALAALKLWVFLPLNAMLELAPGKLGALLDFIERRFPLPDGYVESIRAVLKPGPSLTTTLDEQTPDWARVRADLGTAILASATPEREDRLFPGDIEQFRLGGTGLSHGAAGVLYALHATGQGRHPEHEEWLLEAVRRTPPTRPGLLDGAYGIAFALDTLGHRQAALDLIDGAATLVEQTRDHGYGGGLAGIGLTRLHFAADREHLKAAVATGERLADALAVAAPPDEVGRAGILSGWSGPALLFTRLYDETADPAWLDLAERAVARDLDECVLTDDGALQVRDGGARTLPYVAVGSAGVALVIEELARRRPGAACLERQDDLLRGCHGEFVIHPGLLYGRCGLLSALAAAQRRSPTPERAAAIETHLSALAWHAVPYGGGIAMPGNQLLRLSMDVATGGAGVLLALAAVHDGHGRVLPFLGNGTTDSGPIPGRR